MNSTELVDARQLSDGTLRCIAVLTAVLMCEENSMIVIEEIDNGNVRRTLASKFGEFLRKTAADEAPWKLYGMKFDVEALLYLAEHIEDFAMREMGIGDMSIIYDYERYINDIPAIGTIMIWTTDKHLQGYQMHNVSMTLRRKRRTRKNAGL